jgi:hypothetical protein
VSQIVSDGEPIHINGGGYHYLKLPASTGRSGVVSFEYNTTSGKSIDIFYSFGKYVNAYYYPLTKALPGVRKWYVL